MTDLASVKLVISGKLIITYVLLVNSCRNFTFVISVRKPCAKSELGNFLDSGNAYSRLDF